MNIARKPKTENFQATRTWQKVTFQTPPPQTIHLPTLKQYLSCHFANPHHSSDVMSFHGKMSRTRLETFSVRLSPLVLRASFQSSTSSSTAQPVGRSFSRRTTWQPSQASCTLNCHDRPAITSADGWLAWLVSAPIIGCYFSPYTDVQVRTSSPTPRPRCSSSESMVGGDGAVHR